MNWLDKLERKYGRLGIPNLMLYIVTTMLFVAIFDIVLGIPLSGYFALNRALVMRGQVWRLLTFIFIPPSSSVLTLVLGLYFYYFIGRTLEKVWGTFRFNVYYLFGVLGCMIAGLITGYGSNDYLNLSLFLAFAYLFPNHEVLLFFFIPIKMKYLAYLDWALFAISLIFGSWASRRYRFLGQLLYLLWTGHLVPHQDAPRQRRAAQLPQVLPAEPEPVVVPSAG